VQLISNKLHAESILDTSL